MLCDRGNLPGWSRGSFGVGQTTHPGLVYNHSPPFTMTTFWVYLLHEHQHASYRCLESYQVEASDEGLVKHLEQTALEHIKSRWKFRQMGLLGAARLEIYQVR